MSRASPGVRPSSLRYQHDEAGDLVAVTDVMRNQQKYGYDDEHRLVWQQRPTGLTFHYRYDAAGRCVETWADSPARSTRASPPLSRRFCRMARRPRRACTTFDSTSTPMATREATDSVTFHRYFGN